MNRIPDLIRKHAYVTPDKMATRFEGQDTSWSQFSSRMHKIAKSLLELGVNPGDRVAYLGMNSHWIVEMYLAPSIIGAISVPVNYRLSEAEMTVLIEDCTPQVLIVDRHFQDVANALMKQCSSLQTLIFADWNPPDSKLLGEALIYEDLIASQDEVSPEEFEAIASKSDDTLIIFYTSGTTGEPKGVMLSHSNMLSNSLGTGPIYNYQPDDVLLLSGPLFHLGTGSRVFTSSLYGTSNVIQPKFEVEETMQLIEECKVTTMTMVPTMLQMILDHPRFSDFDFSSLRCLTYGAAPMPVALIQRCMEKIPKVTFCQGYGMTEAAPNVSILSPQDHVEVNGEMPKLGSVGQPIGYTDLRIEDETGASLPQGETGQIVIRGPQIMNGYWNRPDLTADAIRDGFYQTGDAGYIDEDGYLYVVGRTKEMVISGGENVYPIETENCLSKHPAVASSAVFGVPHKKWGEMVYAAVAFKPGQSATEDELIAHCRELIAHYKAPKALMIWEGQLPLNAANKIDKKIIRAKVLEQLND